MSKPTEKALVPALRFSEFDSSWRELHLIDVAEFIDSLHETPKQYVESGYPMIRVVDVKDKGLDLNVCLKVAEEIYSHFTKRYKPQLGDIVFSRVGTCGESVLINFEEDVCLGQNIVLLKPKENSLFLFSYLKSNLIKDQVSRKVVGSSHKTLSLKDAKKFDIQVPCKNEQQKIADCLSSIDDLITAHTQKHEALKAHKKGLMQQLFPATGETVPKLRFPEFLDAGEWGSNTLDELTTRIGDGIHSTPKYDDNGTYYFINGNNLVDGKISISESTKKVDAKEEKNHRRDLSNRTILLSINGTIGNLALYNNEKVMLGKSAAYINLNGNVDIGFIYNTLKTFKIHSYFFSELTGSTIKNLSLKTIRETKMSIPSISEQQKIADFLSSIDDLITAQAQKIKSLKAHKKGLMQQLFPTADKVGA